MTFQQLPQRSLLHRADELRPLRIYTHIHLLWNKGKTYVSCLYCILCYLRQAQRVHSEASLFGAMGRPLAKADWLPLITYMRHF
jgi:hypothetical protein